MITKISRTFASLALALAIAFAGVTPASAQVPANDDFDSATLISGLPFTESINTMEATTAEDDPTTSCMEWATPPSVWYSFTPDKDMTVEADTYASDYVAVLSVFTYSSGHLTEIACNYYEPSLILDLTGGTTYYFLIVSLWETGGNLIFSVFELVPPPNDDFDSATVISEMLFSDKINTRLATTEPEEPNCHGYGGSMPSVWYSFTPADDMTMEINTFGSNYYTFLSIFAGSYGDLTEIACGTDRIRFIATANLQYYFLVQGEGSGGNLSFTAQKYIPQEPPIADFWWGPEVPFASQVVTFCDVSYDPEEFAITSFTWKFHDGTSSTDSCTEYQYRADGDYEVEHSITTQDGRSDSTSKVVQVRTHDVAIARMLAPVTASTGQTRQIFVAVQSLRYDENVAVSLGKLSPEGWVEWIAYSSQYVPARPGNRTTAFKFNYTFTQADALAGQVTFYANAYIDNEAFPENNNATATTKVTR